MYQNRDLLTFPTAAASSEFTGTAGTARTNDLPSSSRQQGSRVEHGKLWNPNIGISDDELRQWDHEGKHIA